MLELGKGFAFVGRQFRVTTETSHFFIDLVFYNYILKCFVLVDLKTGRLTHQDIGQMDMYVRVFEDRMKGDDDSPTVGLILCEHACIPLDEEIEHLASLLAMCASRPRQGEVRT
jgi:hypothetical protein